MNECRCCVAGPRGSTPAATLNRPGLPAITYRAGTHAAFLETMLSRITALTVDAAGLRPLRTLSTRDPDDPVIAFLDAWATVADVLTFYQERIANEGFLGTATERLSVAELARLVGYRLSPGVAAGTFLAYALEPAARVVVPAGSRVQSIPGPDELPQTFETGADLTARGEWNKLDPRRTRPLTPATFDSSSPPGTDALPVYLKGIATGLTAGDPLLVDRGARQDLFRLVSVAPDSVADRTRIELRPWRVTSVERLPPEPVPGPGDPAGIEDPAAVRRLIERSLDLEAAGVQPAGLIAGQMVDVLDRLRGHLGLGMSGDQLHEFLADVVVPQLQAGLGRAQRGRRGPLTRWLEGVTRDFEQMVEQEQAVRQARLAAMPSGSPPEGPPESGSTTIGSVLSGLAKPASVPPANPLRLDRGVREGFAAGSDAAARLLVALRPEIGETLYDAWRNVPSTDGATLKLYALRTRAGAFGGTAPPETTVDEKGVVTRKEWTLDKPNTDQRTDAFEVTVLLPLDARGSLLDLDPGAVAPVTVRIGAASDQVGAEPTIRQLLDGDFPIELPEADEQIRISLLALTDSPITPASLTVDFVQRGMHFEARMEALTEPAPITPLGVTVESRASDPVAMHITSVDDGQPSIRVAIEGTARFVPGRVATEQPDVISLDAVYPAIAPEGWIVIERPDPPGDPFDDGLLIRRVQGVREGTRNDYNTNAKVTSVQLDQPWLFSDDTFAVLRETAVYAQSEELQTVETPIDPVLEPVSGGEIPLDRLYDGLAPGRWLIVSGERTDVAAAGVPVAGIPGVEVAMLGGIRQDFDPAEPGAVTRSTLLLATPLAYRYRRDTVQVFGNVVAATHGETRTEVLGSGAADRANQSFDLKMKPLTYVAASTPTGAESTLSTFVDGLRWREVADTIGLAPTDRCYVTRTADDDTTTMIFGNGLEGARLPTGQENVTGIYRFGIGAAGNLRAGQLSLLGSRPQGVAAVTNPVPSTGGADREDRDQARRNAPLGVTALDRIVSDQDYADFARTFAGIAKASATRLTDGRRSLLHLTIAGEDDVPIAPSSPLLVNLKAALAEFGDPFQPFRIEVRRLLALVVQVKVRLDEDRRWEERVPVIRAAVLDRFAFDRRDLGQDVTRGEVIAAVQNVPGVSWVDLDILDTLDEDRVIGELTTPSAGGLGADLTLRRRIRADLARLGPGPQRAIIPADLVVLRPEVPETLVITEITA